MCQLTTPAEGVDILQYRSILACARFLSRVVRITQAAVGLLYLDFRSSTTGTTDTRGRLAVTTDSFGQRVTLETTLRLLLLLLKCCTKGE